MEDSCAALVNSALTNALSAVFAASPAGVGNGSVELHDDGGARGAVRVHAIGSSEYVFFSSFSVHSDSDILTCVSQCRSVASTSLTG